MGFPTVDMLLTSSGYHACPLHPPAEDGEVPLFRDASYRMVFAVVTTERVILYDTQQLAPFAMVAHLHYAPLSDVAW